MAQRILVCDDDQFLRELYEEILKDEGYEVETAENGEDGLQKLQSHQFDLVLLDMVMPRLDGLGVLTALSLNAQTSKPPIILLTNLLQQQTIDQALQNGAATYLIKTDITPDQLINEVKKYLPS